MVENLVRTPQQRIFVGNLLNEGSLAQGGRVTEYGGFAMDNICYFTSPLWTPQLIGRSEDGLVQRGRALVLRDAKLTLDHELIFPVKNIRMLEDCYHIFFQLFTDPLVISNKESLRAAVLQGVKVNPTGVVDLL